ncbi:MAG: S-layer homology domain-containing protein [Clostridia bacterium]|nr:S-layer homology domain-containing protein [Clostridia bacterium]
MKKLISFIIALSMLSAVYVPYVAYAEESYASTSNDADGNEVEDEATPSPTPQTADDSNNADTEASPTPVPSNKDEEEGNEEMTMNNGNSSSPGSAGGLGFEASKFADCNGHWAEQIIVECTKKNYLDGYPDGKFRPDNPVSAAEFAKIYSAWTGVFYQITEGNWAIPYIRSLLNKGMFDMGEYGDYSAKLTREQVAKAIAVTLKGEYFPSNLDKYKAMIPDLAKCRSENHDAVVKVFMSGIMGGYPDGTFGGERPVTRAEILSIIDRALNAKHRVVPSVVSEAAADTPETNTYYQSALAIRKSTNQNTMYYRLYGSNAQFMDTNDDVTGLKMSAEVQGMNGFALLLRFDISDILKREDKLKSITLNLKAEKGSGELGVFYYDTPVSDTDWNNTDFFRVLNSNAVASDNKLGYNSVVDSITKLLPTWGNTEGAVAQEKKTKPVSVAQKDGDKYTFTLDIADLKAHMSDNTVELFVTTTDYDNYNKADEKIWCYVAGGNGPKLHASFESSEEIQTTIRVLAERAKVEGGMLNVFGEGENSYVENFRTDQKMTFEFDAQMEGTYSMKVYYSANVNSGGGTATFNINCKAFDHTFAQTGAWSAYVYEDLGEVELETGTNTLVITDKEVPNTYLINIKNIVFERVQ